MHFCWLSVDEWEYTVEKDEKVAKVGMTMQLYEASTGKLMWKAGHAITESYMLIKPELPKVARDVVSKMVIHAALTGKQVTLRIPRGWIIRLKTSIALL